MSEIALLGLGAMHQRMAVNLLKAGYSVSVYNRTANVAKELVALGAMFYDTPRAAVKNAAMVFSMVRDDGAAEYVWLDEEDGALQGMAEGAIAVECSTVSVAGFEKVRKACEARQVVLIDAPVVGSRPQAEAGQLHFLVAGDDRAIQRIMPALEVNAAMVHVVGKAGNAVQAKLAVNAYFALQVNGLAEILAAIEGMGDVAKEHLFDVMCQLPVMSLALVGAGKMMVTENYTPMFPIGLVAKDLGYFCALDVEGKRLMQRVAENFSEAVEEGYGEDNIVGIAQIYG